MTAQLVYVGKKASYYCFPDGTFNVAPNMRNGYCRLLSLMDLKGESQQDKDAALDALQELAGK